MSKSIFALVLGMLLVPNLGFANDLVVFPPGAASWKVDLADSTSSQHVNSSGSHIVTIMVDQDARKRRTRYTWSDGQVTERWEVPGQNLILAEDSNGQPFTTGNFGLVAQSLSAPFVASDFDWLKPELLESKDPISYSGKMCYHYVGTTMIGVASSGPMKGLGTQNKEEAWIDSKTLLPVALDNGFSLGIFTFSKEPPAPFSLPAKFLNVYYRYEQSMGNMSKDPL